MKKLSCILLALLMVVSVAGCRSADTTSSAAPGGTAAPAAEGAPLVGIITGTVSQGEEEFQAAQKMMRVYGDAVVSATYPDKFSEEVDTTIAQVMSIADQGVKAIVFCQAVPGAIAAMTRVREKYPDMLFVTGVVAEAPAEVAAIADICMLVDEISMGTTVIEQAAAQGAKTFIHYSFPRHLGYETIARRRELFMENCARLGIEYVDVTAPDPTAGDGTPAAAQQFMVEDVPRQIAQYGVDTAFFSTNCAMQEALIRTVIEQKGIYPQQCCPSPYHGMPAALNISTAGHEGDVQYMLDSIADKVAAAGNSGRVSTWAVPVNMLMIEAGTDYAMRWVNGEFTERHDDAQLRASIDKISQEYDTASTLSYYADANGELDNFYMILSEFYNF